MNIIIYIAMNTHRNWEKHIGVKYE